MQAAGGVEVAGGRVARRYTMIMGLGTLSKHEVMEKVTTSFAFHGLCGCCTGYIPPLRQLKR
jgi:hypothetical protein